MGIVGHQIVVEWFWTDSSEGGPGWIVTARRAFASRTIIEQKFVPQGRHSTEYSSAEWTVKADVDKRFFHAMARTEHTEHGARVPKEV
jgi:hypothetical protein